MTPHPPQPRHNPDDSSAFPRSSPSPPRKDSQHAVAGSPPLRNKRPVAGRPESERGTNEDDGKPEEEDGEDDDGDSGGDDADDYDDDEEEEEEEEPQLKYARLTQHLSAVYRNGDATSAFLVAGDKMVRFRLPSFVTCSGN